MVTELPPPPAPLIERLEASFPSPYEYLWASPEAVPAETERPVRLASSESAMANPIKLLLDRLGSFLPLFGGIRDEKMPVTENSTGGEPNGIGDPVPAGDPIPVGGGGGGPNGG